MEKIWLRLRAPFAAFRYFQAGVYRATSPTIPHSAAWGLVLNLAGIDVRINENNAISEIDPDAPKLLIAVGAITDGEKSTLYQQLHSYPVGTSGKDVAERTRGTKYWIAPVKRELLVGFDAMLGVQSHDKKIIEKIALGLSGELDVVRYGLPFAGDNNLLFDHIQIIESPVPARWYTPVEQNDSPPKNSCRLSIKIDRVDSSKSRSLLFAPGEVPSELPPNTAWIWTPDTVAA